MEMEMDVASPIPNICCSRVRFFVLFFCAGSVLGLVWSGLVWSRAWSALVKHAGQIGFRKSGQGQGQAHRPISSFGELWRFSDVDPQGQGHGHGQMVQFCINKFPLAPWVENSHKGQLHVQKVKANIIHFAISNFVVGKSSQGQGQDHDYKVKLDMVHSAIANFP